MAILCFQLDCTWNELQSRTYNDLVKNELNEIFDPENPDTYCEPV